VFGDRRGNAYQAIKDAFGLKELIWIETREHESFEGFEPYVARPDVAAVLLAIRWASHSYGEVKDFCDQYGKPLVRLPGGYGLNQVAAPRSTIPPPITLCTAGTVTAVRQKGTWTQVVGSENRPPRSGQMPRDAAAR
jgi:hypothetical protein